MRKIYNQLLYAWYAYPLLFVFLYPFSLIYSSIIFIRRFLYEKKLLNKYRAPCPVIVVGNFVVGGTGKTPTVIALAQLLKAKGYNPGIITRGYGSLSFAQNIYVMPDSDPRLVGDESVLIAKKTNCPVLKNKNRAIGAKLLAESCDVIISDDGLQHYALASDIRIALLAETKWLHNSFCLPAGPWREPKSQLASVDFLVHPQIAVENLSPLNNNSNAASLSLSQLKHQTVHAVCAIAAPWRFFSMLNGMEIYTINHAYPDHYALNLSELTYPADEIVLITEKDAVKCRDYNLQNVWVVKIRVVLDDQFSTLLLEKLAAIKVK